MILWIRRRISTHTPLAGRDVFRIRCIPFPPEFLLTRPLRDVTKEVGRADMQELISTHTPLAGRDGKRVWLGLDLSEFLLTRPLRDVTWGQRRIY